MSGIALKEWDKGYNDYIFFCKELEEYKDNHNWEQTQMKIDVTNYSREFPEAFNNEIVKTSGTRRTWLVCLNLELQNHWDKWEKQTNQQTA